MSSVREAKKGRISLPRILKAKVHDFTQITFAIHHHLHITLTSQLGTCMESRLLIFGNIYFKLDSTIIYTEVASWQNRNK